jgi:hypothetical protein
MCCYVHYCDNNFYNQQMHTLYFVGCAFVGYKSYCQLLFSVSKNANIKIHKVKLFRYFIWARKCTSCNMERKETEFEKRVFEIHVATCYRPRQRRLLLIFSEKVPFYLSRHVNRHSFRILGKQQFVYSS